MAQNINQFLPSPTAFGSAVKLAGPIVKRSERIARRKEVSAERSSRQYAENAIVKKIRKLLILQENVLDYLDFSVGEIK
jgi:hypothetical protein